MSGKLIFFISGCVSVTGEKGTNEEVEDDYEEESEYEIRSLRKRKKKKLVLSISLSSLYCPASYRHLDAFTVVTALARTEVHGSPE